MMQRQAPLSYRRSIRRLMLVSALGAGCSAGPPGTTLAPPVATAPVSAVAVASAPAGPADALAAADAQEQPPFVSTTPELARFHAALHQLERGASKRHVRILWVGDSHGQADFWSGQLRRLLAERFGGGGPGFVHMGYKNYRHDGLKLDIHGKWRMRPKKPVDPRRQDDGVFGLGGLMMSGYADAPRVQLALSEPLRGELARYDICYRFHDEHDALAYAADGEPEKTLFVKDAERGVVRHLELTGSALQPLLVVRPIGRTNCAAWSWRAARTRTRAWCSTRWRSTARATEPRWPGTTARGKRRSLGARPTW